METALNKFLETFYDYFSTQTRLRLNGCTSWAGLELVANALQLVYPLPTYRIATTFENIVAKGEIGHDEQFLLWPQCF